MSSLRVIAIVCIALVYSGCTALGPLRVQDTDSLDESLTVLESAMAPEPTLLDALFDAEAEAQAEDAERVPDIDPSRFDLHVEDADVKDFFRGLVADTEYNMVVHPDVGGRVSLSLKDVSVVEVMDIMREVYGYDSHFNGRVIQVFPDALRTDIYHLNYLNVARQGRSEIQVSAGSVGDAQNGNGSGGDYGQSGNRDGGSGDSQSVIGTSVNTSANTDLWSEITVSLENLVATDEGSHVVVTPQVGLIVVRARPVTQRAVARYLNMVEGTLTRQVILEAKIVEVTLNEGFQAGIDWHTFGDASGGSFDPGVSVLPDDSVVATAGSEHSVAGELTSGNFDIFNPLGSGFTLNTAFGDFDATIDLLRTQGSVQVLSSPRISTVNNQKAVIKVGSDEFFVTDISSNTVTAGSAINTNDSPELTPFFSGIALDVTPQISARGEIILHVHPTVSEVTEQRKDIGGEIVPLAASTIRESDSIVRARSGQVIVIGGLMQNTSRDDGAAVPGLGRIPLFGHLFKQTARTGLKSELVILLRPVVVDGAEQSRFIGESAARAKRLRAEMRRRG